MKYVPFYPLFRFILIIIIHGGLSPKGILHLAPWLVKLILFEPLRWLEVIICERRIEKTTINQPPVFILGHYRSGTTFLQRIFCCDARFGHMSVFEDALPELMLLFEKLCTPLLQRISNLLKAQNEYHRIPFNWSLPGEEDLGLVAMSERHAVSWGFLFPKKFKTIFHSFFILKDPDLSRAWKREYMYLVKKISLKHKGKPLVLKSPPNTARVKELLDLFPGARFVYISRTAAEVFVSSQRLWQVTMKRHVLGPTDHIDLDELVTYTMELFHHNWMEDKKLIPPHQYIELQYQDLLEDPETVIQHIYTRLRLQDFNYCKTSVRQFLESQKSYKTIQHKIPGDIKERIIPNLFSQ